MSGFKQTPYGRLRLGGSRTALDGSRVTDFTDSKGRVVVQKFSRKGDSWWQAVDRLCSTRDIDAARDLEPARVPTGATK
jgi:hypothetical protein